MEREEEREERTKKKSSIDTQDRWTNGNRRECVDRRGCVRKKKKRLWSCEMIFVGKFYGVDELFFTTATN